MRLFIAVNFNDNTNSRLLSLRDELQSKSIHGNFTGPDNLHLTLVFLGDCNATQTITIKSIMDNTKFEPFAVTIDSVGRFKHDGGDLWWAGVRENKILNELHRCLTDKLKSTGFIIDKRRFNPHITLGREITTYTKPWKIEPFGETVYGIELMKSEKIKGMLKYTVIYSSRVTVT